MIKQRRASKTRALRALETYYGDSGPNKNAYQHSLSIDGEEIYDGLNSLFDINGFSIDHHHNNNNKSVAATRLSISNVKKKFIVEQFQRDIFVPTEIIMSKGKGNGVKVLEDVESGVLVVEYKGELIGKQEAERRERLYARNSKTLRMDCYLFFFEHKGKVMCVDPTIPSVDLGHGRYINHKVDGNLDPIKIQVDGVPKIVLISNRSIKRGEELFFDYGDRSSTSLTYFPWLRDDYKPMSDDEEDIQDEQVVATTKISTPSETTSSTTTNRPPLKLILKRKETTTTTTTTTIIASSSSSSSSSTLSSPITNENNNNNCSNNDIEHYINNNEKEKENNYSNNGDDKSNDEGDVENENNLEREIVSLANMYDSESPGDMSDLDLESIDYDEYDINKWRTNIYELDLPTGLGLSVIEESASITSVDDENNTTTTTNTINVTAFHNIKRIRLKYKEKQDD